MNTQRLCVKRALAGVVAAAALSGLPVMTSTAHADPSCSVSASGSVANRNALTVTVKSNPCGRQVRAWVECVTATGYTSQKTSGSTTGTGTLRVDCGTAYVNRSGHEVYVSGQGWTRYVY